MRHSIALIALVCVATICSAQSNYFEVNAGDGYGLRFWGTGQNAWKLHMGNAAEYHYGPVYDYSIKTNMDTQAGRGWTWGTGGVTPVAALSSAGEMQIAGSFFTGPVYVSGGGAGRMSISGVGGELSLVSRAVSGFVNVPSQGERWVIYNDGTATDGKLRFWSGGDKVAITKEGSVGIGTSAPAMPLDVSGLGARLKNPATSASDYTTFRLQGPDYANGLEIDFFGNNNYTGASYGGGVGSVFIGNINAKPLVFGTSNTARMTLDASGNVGIGTSSPDQKLTVNGTVHATRVKVETTVPGPDYVFEKDYALPSLEQIKSYIEENKHLPEVPSAKEMEAKGIDVGEMNMLLLKKVEELTLYVIELKEEMKQKEIQLQSQIDKLCKK
jgi:hypothetical protein